MEKNGHMLIRRACCGFWMFFVCLGLIVVAGCGNGFGGSSEFDESEIVISNYDEEDYLVRLYDAKNDTLEIEIRVDENDQEVIDDVDDGRYYISIFRVGTGTREDRSDDFRIKYDIDRYFSIDSDGNIN